MGYSYFDGNDNKFTDESTAEENLFALNQWYKKFSNFQKNDLYISGESYAGIYVPTLVD